MSVAGRPGNGSGRRERFDLGLGFRVQKMLQLHLIYLTWGAVSMQLLYNLCRMLYQPNQAAMMQRQVHAPCTAAEHMPINIPACMDSNSSS